ncbi:beta-galactosidase [Brachybacterium sp. GCM10030267]|uniref:beta-galactosidase n=1 Tax=Brachybacterium sp. GCM10030267 TaxID=3273381 RepID=UPI0036240414
MPLPPLTRIGYGGDYNPEQWPEQIWEEDYRAFDLAAIDTVTVGVFIWSLTQPAEETYDFTVLDRIIDKAEAEGRQVCLATGTGGMPPWLAHEYPEVTRTDFEGRRHLYGQRHNFCPSSPAHRRLSGELARRVAERYGQRDCVIAWHVANEYGGACYCELCAAEFRRWLREKYGDLETLNHAWNTTFWSHRFTDFEQIVPPSALSEHWRGPDHTAFQGITLDYLRFTSDNLLGSYLIEKNAIREHSDKPVTTNFMGLFRPVDYHRWAEHLDFASWDNYPPDPDTAAPRMALAHDLMRGLKGGQPFWLMEQTPSTTASRDVNAVKRPGIMRLWTWQAVAHGADAALFFQMRHSRGACEKYHGAVIGHSGRTDTRTFTEVAQLGHEFEALGDTLLDARTPARVALLFDWDSWWAVEISDGPNRHVKYPRVMLAHYRSLWEAGAQVDVLPVTADLSGYDVVVAPLLHMIKGDTAERLEAVARRGGTVLSTVLAGRVDEDDNAFLADVPGPLASLFGIRIDETDAQPVGVINPVQFPETEVGGSLVFDLIQPDGAETVATFGADFYAGMPAITRHRTGRGEAWYVGTVLDDQGIDIVIRRILRRHDLLGPFADVEGVELAIRGTGPEAVHHVLNHASEPRRLRAHLEATDLLSGREIAEGDEIELAPADILVLRPRARC